MSDIIEVRVDPASLVGIELTSYLVEYNLTRDDVRFLGYQDNRLLFKFTDPQKAMMFKLRFGG